MPRKSFAQIDGKKNWQKAAAATRKPNHGKKLSISLCTFSLANCQVKERSRESAREREKVRGASKPDKCNRALLIN